MRSPTLKFQSEFHQC